MRRGDLLELLPPTAVVIRRERGVEVRARPLAPRWFAGVVGVLGTGLALAFASPHGSGAAVVIAAVEVYLLTRLVGRKSSDLPLVLALAVPAALARCLALPLDALPILARPLALLPFEWIPLLPLLRRAKHALTVRDADASGSDLARCVLVGLRLEGVRLDGADLSGAALKSVRFDGCSLDGADLSGAEVAGSTFRRTTARRANLDGARLTALSILDGDFGETTAEGARWWGCEIVRSDLRAARLAQSRFDGCSFTDLDLSDADLRGVRMRNLPRSASMCVRRVRWAGAAYDAATEWPDAVIPSLTHARREGP